MGELLLTITLLHATIYFVINLIVLYFFARNKPEKYYDAYRISLLPILLNMIYKLGWNASMAHHNIPYANQSQLPDYTNGMLLFLMLLHLIFFEKLAKLNMEKSKDEEKGKSTTNS